MKNDRREAHDLHEEKHPLAGKNARYALKSDDGDPREGECRVEDWWDRMNGVSWMHSGSNPAALQYAMRSAQAHLPIDDDVVYVKIGPFGHILHSTELREA